MTQDIVRELSQMMQDQSVEQEAAKKVGVSLEDVQKLFLQGVPLLFGGIERNAQSAEGEEALRSALRRDHNGDILTHLQDVIQNPQGFKGEKILRHVFGEDAMGVIGKLSSSTGLSLQETQRLMEMVAPMALGALGKEEGAIQNMPEFFQKHAGGEVDLQGVFSRLLDQDQDGSVMDDLWEMGKKAFLR